MKRIINNLRVWVMLLALHCYGTYDVSAQSAGIGSWNIVNLKYQVSNRLSFFGEAQLRSLKFYNQFHYYEYKGGINYKVNDKMVMSLGAGSYQTFAEGGNFLRPKNNDEFRLWPQILLLQSIGRFTIEQRYRAELRFTSNGYRNRFRYRLGINFPLGEKKKDKIPFQAFLNNELFFTDREPFFERNRMALGLQYRMNANTNILLGYLHQFDYRINDETGRDFIQIGYYLNIGHNK